jgi:hypothetical protein
MPELRLTTNAIRWVWGFLMERSARSCFGARHRAAHSRERTGERRGAEPGGTDGIWAVENGGGSGVFSTLHLVRSQDGQVVDTAHVTLGDRINLTSLSIQDGKLAVGMTTQGPDEPMCCGTQRQLDTLNDNGTLWSTYGANQTHYDQVKAVVMAGGSGTRFWPKSRLLVDLKLS